MQKKYGKHLLHSVCAMAMALVMVFSMIPVQAFAAENNTEATPVAAAADAQVTVTVNDKGVLAKDKNGSPMLNRSVTVSDLDSDGKLTVDEALVAAHEAYLTQADYGTQGEMVNKLWGTATTNALFFVNGAGISTGVGTDTVKNGDALTASVNKDDTYYSDWYTSFDASSKQVSVNEEFTLNLTGHLGMAYEPADKADRPVAGVSVGTWDNGAFTALDGKTTDAAGNVTLSFATPGTYYVTASGTVKAKVQDWSNGGAMVDADAPIIAPGCVVTVEKPAETAVPENLQLSSLTFRDGFMKSSRELMPEPAFDPAVKDYTLVVPDTDVNLCVWATLGTAATGEIQAVYPNGRTVTIKSGSKNAAGIRSALSPDYLTSTVLPLTVDGQESYRITMVRQATLKELTVEDTTNNTDLTQITKDFKNGKTVFEASVPEDAVISVAAKPTVYKAKITLNGQDVSQVNGQYVSQVTPSWSENGTFDLTVCAEGSDARSLEYVIHFTSTGSAIESMKISRAPDKVKYSIGEKFDPAGMEILVTYKNGTTETLKADQLTYSPAGELTLDDRAVTITYKKMQVQQPITVGSALDGQGTEADPYLLRTVADLETIKTGVDKGTDYADCYFKLEQDITMPANWAPISKGKGPGAFAGTLDGAGHTLTFPENSKPLFNYVFNAKICNLNIYAPFMDGYALVDNHEVYSQGSTTEIRNVTIKSGSVIKCGGFIGGYASGANVVNFTDCVVEKNVKIGCLKDGTPSGMDYVGSFGGRMNGTVKNCVSYADVYGVNRVGGIVGGMGQTMGKFLIQDCRFYGTVTATGEMVGGIAGAGYSDTEFGPAANSPCVQIIGCTASGNVSGDDKVGGILGCEKTVQCWDNGIGKIQNNQFSGKLHANKANAGGIVGVMIGLDRYNEISNNIYNKDCGVSKGAGLIKYVDTSCATHETASGATYFDSSKSIPKLDIGDMGAWGQLRKNHNRTDDPLGADAEKLWRVETEKPTVLKLEASGNFKKDYMVGEDLDLTGIELTAHWSNGTTTKLNLSDVQVTGYDKTKVGKQTVSLTYGTAKLEIPVTVNGDTVQISVSIAILGDTAHGEDGQVHTNAEGNLNTWLAEKSFAVNQDSTVRELIDMALAQIGATSNNPSGNYIKSITYKGETVGEKTNGANSGWMYTLNGIYPDNGVAQQKLSEGDVVVLHYTDDYTKEKSHSPEADNVITLITAIQFPITLDSAEAIVQARNAYNQLTPAQRKLVTNYPELEKAEKELAVLQASEADKKAAKAVEDQIDAIGTVTLDSAAKIQEVRDAYDGLTELQQKLVGNYDKLTAAETKLALLKANGYNEVYKAAGDTLEAQAAKNTPQVGSVGGEWLILGLARSGRAVPAGYYDNVCKYVKENINAQEQLHRAKSTDNSRVILALTSIGKDVTNVGGHNLLMGLTDMKYLSKQGINGPIWALIAFDSHNYAIPTNSAAKEQVTREKLVAAILDAQLPDGGWALMADGVSDPDFTGMALQALAPYYRTDAKVKAAVDKALSWLSSVQTAKGEFGAAQPDGTALITSESNAQVLVALTALGIDPATDSRFVKNGLSVVDALCSFAVDGGFSHLPGKGYDQMATEQVYYALTAYNRFVKGNTRLYDMTDVKIGSEAQPTKPDTVTPATGDNSPVEMVFVLMTGSMMVLAALVYAERRRKHAVR